VWWNPNSRGWIEFPTQFGVRFLQDVETLSITIPLAEADQKGLFCGYIQHVRLANQVELAPMDVLTGLKSITLENLPITTLDILPLIKGSTYE
jgi:hypothetical protein